MSLHSALVWLGTPWERKWDEPVDDWWLTRFERRQDRLVAAAARLLLRVMNR